MKILSADKIRELDQYTIQKEPIASIHLMERAAGKFVDFLLPLLPDEAVIYVFCGPGNNGGDGLVAARLLRLIGFSIKVFVCRIGSGTSEDFSSNMDRLQDLGNVPINRLDNGEPFPEIPAQAVIIDAIFGSGLNRPVEGYWAGLLEYLNERGRLRVSVDVPSGLFTDSATEGASFQAHHTFSFELPKLAFLFPENSRRVGKWSFGSIGLHPEGLQQLDTNNFYIQKEQIRSLLRPREAFSHKGTFGHALLICGSYGKMGAAVLAGAACLRSGVGLTSLHVPKSGYSILQTSIPEAMTSIDPDEEAFSSLDEVELDDFSAIGVGCGWGLSDKTAKAFEKLLEKAQSPIVIDADALNLLSQDKKLLEKVPEGSILTPHPGEFRRLFGESPNDFDRNNKQREAAEKYNLNILLKGAYSCLATPEGNCYFNSTGNPGMATGGSGDVLTGLLAGLLAQGYSPLETALLGMYIHGLAGDIAAESTAQEALTAGDIYRHFGKAFKRVNG
jgi:hydroxyethylthiazole kinase-like uncharacterized protein yjeF